MTTNSTNIYFINTLSFPNGKDSTQFDTQDDKELAELWFQFCKDEGIITEVYKGIADYETGEMIEEENK